MSEFDDLLQDTVVDLNTDISGLLDEPEGNKPPVTPLSGEEFTGDIEVDKKTELTAIQQAFRDRAKEYKRKRLYVEDSEFWVAVCFRSREDKERFLKEHGLAHLGDKYLNGYLVSAALDEQKEV